MIHKSSSISRIKPWRLDGMRRHSSPFCVDLKISHASESDVGVENMIQSMIGNGMIFAW